MKDSVSREIEKIYSFRNSIGHNTVGILGSARTKDNEEYYQQAKLIARTLSKNGFQIISGGGPGIMKAAIEGVRDAGEKSIALNIRLPFEDNVLPNDKISLNFDYFMTRKLACAQYCNAFVVMPGGFGTLDELFEMLTLMQTKKMAMKPVFLFGTNFWNGLWQWIHEVYTENFISDADLKSILITDKIADILMHLR